MNEATNNEEDEGNELYRDLNVNLEGSETVMTVAPLHHVQATQETKDTHVILTAPINYGGQHQSSSVSSGFVSNMLNPRPDTSIDSIFNTEATLLVQTVNEQLEAEVMTRSSTESKTSLAIAANLSELELKKILIEKMESNKLILDTYGDNVSFKRRIDDEDNDEEPSDRISNGGLGEDRARATEEQSDEERSQHPDWFEKPAKIPSPDHDWNKTLPADHGPVQPWLSTLAQIEDPRESINELMDTPLDFSAFVMNRLKVDTLTPELLAGPTFELMKGSCKSLVELEYLVEEVFNATTDQLDWNNPEVEWHNYKHLDWITVCRDDDMLYKFKEGNFNRLRIQDIEDMLPLLVQGKLTNLTIEEYVDFNVSLRMFTRSVVIQRRVEDLQLGVKSYNDAQPFTQKLKMNKDKKNKLTRIDELHKFTDGSLDDVQTALNDRLKGIRMQYLPQTIWKQRAKDNARAMIQSIELTA
ncbi:hypothetical protein Tco_0148927 [Tanacetum coccineum]